MARALGAAALGITTGAVVACKGLASWAALRFLGGVASGLVFVLVSASVLEALPMGFEAYAGILYSGVGSGIALSGTVAALLPATPWQTPWLLLAGVSAVLAAPSWLQRPDPVVSRPPVAPVAADGLTLHRLAIAYFMEGLGYIVSGTFAVTAVQHTPRLAAWGPWVWVATGEAAAPSALIWNHLARRLSARRALLAAYAVQATGMALPALFGSPSAALAGALLFGGTFMGIVTVLLDLARRLAPSSASRTIGTFTVVFGVGQALGPILAGWLTRAVGDPAPAALAAAGAVGFGALLLATPRPDAALHASSRA